MNNSSIHILLVEDEPSLAMIVKESLETRGLEVSLFTNGKYALQGFKKGNYDLVVLDVMMPEKNGFEVAQEIRAQDEEIPIIFLTAKSQTDDVLKGFHVGGNDYIKKPFSMEELIVRIHNLLDRKKLQQSAEQFPIGAFTFNFPQQRLIYKSEEPIKLTHREAHLLYHLWNNKNKVLDRSYILQKLWGSDDFFSGRSMDVFITKLRKKLNQDPTIEILNVRGYGYKLVIPAN